MLLNYTVMEIMLLVFGSIVLGIIIHVVFEKWLEGREEAKIESTPALNTEYKRCTFITAD